MRTKKKYFMPQWALTKIESVAKFYETTKTQALLLMLSKGSNYYEKVMKKARAESDKAPTDNNVADITDADTEIITQEAKDKWSENIEETIRIAKTRLPYDNE